MAFEIVMPHMGEGVIEGTISQWLIKEGDTVAQFDPILEIETDKVTTEATAEQAGTLLKILVAEGETVPVGTVLGYLGEAGETIGGNAGKSTTSIGQPIPASAPVLTAAPPPHSNGGMAPAHPRSTTGLGRISPVVARIASEHDIDLTQVVGTGREGRITKKNVLAYLAQREATPTPATSIPAVAPVPVVPAPTPIAMPASTPYPTPMAAPTPVSAGIPGELVKLTKMRQAIADHMVRSKATSPHVTTVFEVDFTSVAEHRKGQKALFARDGVKLTFTAYIIAAMAQALKKHPLVNSTWQTDGIFLKKEINIGMATAIDDGLIVPVLKQADGLNLLGIARQVNDLAERARANQLKPDEVQGGTFTLTNHGISGSLFATPIINQPQCGILGVGKIEKRVRVIHDAIAIRLMSYVSFTFDHRILDGATADYFVATFKDIIENWQ